ncbi:FtsK/SpoIIIE domain-containing protein [Nocardioides immobilis]|uniref:FtsK/SpoIIIE domain-containing protein n=1 Tax=Nocardioides immobilis TaxID=2049295 RepID=UPI0015FC83B8|nr:FtsK/SpoIIIE domain-containing protein [Nocardioides immobilis]
MTLPGALEFIGRCAGYACVLLGAAWLAWPWSLAPTAAVTLMATGALIWSWWHPASFGRASGCLRGWIWRRAIVRDWETVCARCGLAEIEVPAVRRSRVAFPHVELQVRPALGQTISDFEGAAEAVRSGVGASRVRVEACGTRDVLLTFTVGDPLRLSFDARPAAALEQLDAVPMGRREDGLEWRLAIGPHTLVAGSSGSGKGSVFWSLAFGLAPAVHSGRVQLHGIDLKGGMEVLMGRTLFTTTATNAAEAVAVLELLVGWMRERAQRYAGQVRSHVPSVDEPLHVVMIDELAALTAYCPERDLQRRAETAINLLCSQGRAPGFMVFACLQDPRKEVIPARGLFTQMVGLRLKDLSETSMVLGETAVLSGAHCHRIPRDMPGTGYVLPEEGGHPIRVRAGFASDRAIREVADRFATSAAVPIVVPDPDPQDRPRRTRSSEVAS